MRLLAPRIAARPLRGSLLGLMRGFTLLEVMVGITLLVIIVLPLASLYAVSLTTIQQAALYSQALQLARDRMELAQLVDYDALNYDLETFAPGFEFTARTSGPGRFTMYDNRDHSSTTEFEFTYDPTDTSNEGYETPVYRDYYNNFTGDLLDPNFNGLCDDDLNGDGIVDIADINIANPNGDVWNTGGIFPFLDGQPRCGDGLYDTIVEGLYADSYDVLFGIRGALKGRGIANGEGVAPIQDELLKYDIRRFRGGPGTSIPNALPDFEHRNRTFDLFCRMTSIIDPTPRVADPQDSGTLVDIWYLLEKIDADSYTQAQTVKLLSCLDRDLPLWEGANSLTVGPHRTTGDPTVIETQFRQMTGLNQVSTQPRQGKKVIVRVFYLSGEGEQVDVDADGFPDGETFATANQVVLERMIADPGRYASGNNLITGQNGALDSIVAPRMKLDENTYLNTGTVVPDVVGDDFESDFCALDNDGLPYYAQAYFPNQ